MQRRIVVRPVGGSPDLGASGASAPARAGRSRLATEAGAFDTDVGFPSNDPAKPDGTAKSVRVDHLRAGVWDPTLPSMARAAGSGAPQGRQPCRLVGERLKGAAGGCERVSPAGRREVPPGRVCLARPAGGAAAVC